jgi:predicted nucleic acid-binding protein
MRGNYRDAICYLDTNIWIYVFDQAAPAKQRVSKDILLHFHRTGRGRISVQIMSEWRNTMIKKFSHLVSAELRRRFIGYLSVWQPLPISPDILLNADELCDRYHFSPYDSIHIQCALEMNCQYFLSEDMQDGLVVDESLTICNPYAGAEE